MTGDTSFEDRLRDTVTDSVPGIAVSIVDADGVRDAVGSGMADLASGQLASPDMICPWFSMTKIVTATAAMRLNEQGSLDLDAPIAPHVPQMRHLRPPRLRPRSPPAISSRIAPDWRTRSRSGGSILPISRLRPRCIPRGFAFEALEAAFRAGSEVQLLEPGTLVLGTAMANLTHTPFTDLVRQEVLDPLGMGSTGFAYSPAMDPRRRPGITRSGA